MGRFAKVLAEIAKRLKSDGEFTLEKRIAAYKVALKENSDSISTRKRDIVYPGLTEGRERAESLDDFLIHILDEAASAANTGKSTPPVMVVVALGGYGRMELNPISDVDVTFIHGGGAKFPAGFEFIVREVYDIISGCDFTLGHSTRSLNETISEANKEMQSKTAMLESRLLWGAPTLYEKFRARFEKECIAGKVDWYLKLRVTDQAERHGKYGETPYMQEPNIKNGCGGLRDFQNLHWMAFFKYRTRTLADMQARDLIGATERKHLEAAYDFLLRARNELHYQTNRPVDVLSKSLQPTVATHLGYGDRSPSRRLEKFMRDFYNHSRDRKSVV